MEAVHGSEERATWVMAMGRGRGRRAVSHRRHDWVVVLTLLAARRRRGRVPSESCTLREERCGRRLERGPRSSFSTLSVLKRDPRGPVSFQRKNGWRGECRRGAGVIDEGRLRLRRRRIWRGYNSDGSVQMGTEVDSKRQTFSRG